MNLFNLDQSTNDVDLDDVQLRLDLSIGEVSHVYPIHKHHSDRLNINIATHLVQNMPSHTCDLHQIFDRNAWECV